MLEYRYGSNFWELNQDLLIIKSLKELYEGDRSKGKEESSNIMWAIYFVYDYCSKYSKHPLDLRIKLVEENFLGESGYFEKNSLRLKEVIEVYLWLQKDSERRYLDTWQEIVESRRIYLEDLAKKLNKLPDGKKDMVIEVLDRALLNTEKILAQKDEILKRINKLGERTKGDLDLTKLALGEFEKNVKKVDRKSLEDILVQKNLEDSELHTIMKARKDGKGKKEKKGLSYSGEEMDKVQ